MSEKLKLLIADDEPWICENIRSLLNWDDLSIEILPNASNGEEALTLCEKEAPDILITDINMPFMDGNQLIAAAGKKYPALQVIVLSGYDDFAFVREALLHGAIDYLLKPVNRTSLLDVIRKAIWAIGENRKDAIEKEEISHQLLQATSIISDGDYSQLLKETDRGERNAILSHLELEYSMFTFLLVKMIDLTAMAQKKGVALNEVIYNGKRELERIFRSSRSVIFNYIAFRTEFIVLTDMDRNELESKADSFMTSLKKRTGSRIRLFISKPCFSFEGLPGIYSSARLSLASRKCSSGDVILITESPEKSGITRRISSEHERKLNFAAITGNRELADNVIFREIGLNRDEIRKWLVIEVSQTLDYILGIFRQNFNRQTSSILLIENYSYLLNGALNRDNFDELDHLLHQFTDDLFSENQAPSAFSSMNSTVDRVVDYIKQNYFREISLSTLAEMFSLDRSYLCRSFKNITGETLMLYIAKTRIAKAQEYIRQSRRGNKEISLSEISDLVGYDDYAYFNRVFRKIAGASPSEFREGIER